MPAADVQPMYGTLAINIIAYVGVPLVLAAVITMFKMSRDLQKVYDAMYDEGGIRDTIRSLKQKTDHHGRMLQRVQWILRLLARQLRSTNLPIHATEDDLNIGLEEHTG